MASVRKLKAQQGYRKHLDVFLDALKKASYKEVSRRVPISPQLILAVDLDNALRHALGNVIHSLSNSDFTSSYDVSFMIQKIKSLGLDIGKVNTFSLYLYKEGHKEILFTSTYVVGAIYQKNMEALKTLLACGGTTEDVEKHLEIFRRNEHLTDDDCAAVRAVIAEHEKQFSSFQLSKESKAEEFVAPGKKESDEKIYQFLDKRGLSRRVDKEVKIHIQTPHEKITDEVTKKITAIETKISKLNKDYSALQKLIKPSKSNKVLCRELREKCRLLSQSKGKFAELIGDKIFSGKTLKELNVLSNELNRIEKQFDDKSDLYKWVDIELGKRKPQPIVSKKSKLKVKRSDDSVEQIQRQKIVYNANKTKADDVIKQYQNLVDQLKQLDNAPDKEIWLEVIAKIDSVKERFSKLQESDVDYLVKLKRINSDLSSVLSQAIDHQRKIEVLCRREASRVDAVRSIEELEKLAETLVIYGQESREFKEDKAVEAEYDYLDQLSSSLARSVPVGVHETKSSQQLPLSTWSYLTDKTSMWAFSLPESSSEEFKKAQQKFQMKQ